MIMQVQAGAGGSGMGWLKYGGLHVTRLDLPDPTGACVAPRGSALSCVDFSWVRVIAGDVLCVSPVGFPAGRTAV